jgi:hypothetical protein
MLLRSKKCMLKARNNGHFSLSLRPSLLIPHPNPLPKGEGEQPVSGEQGDAFGLREDQLAGF